MVTQDMLRTAPSLLGRVRRTMGVPDGIPQARAAGDGGYQDLGISRDARSPGGATYPGHGGGGRALSDGNWGSSSFGGLRNPMDQRPGAWYSPGGPGGAYGGGWADGILTVRDRHVMVRQGTVRNPHGGGSSLPSPEKDGPPARQYQMVDTTESWQLGTDLTTNEDNDGQHNTVGAYDGSPRIFPLGTQDGSFTRVMGPPLGTWREYGVRGPRGMHGPAPDVWDPNWVPGGRVAGGSGGAGGRGKLVETGAEGMQPQDARFVYGGVPHGLHSPTVDARRVTMARQANIVQPQPARQDRPASSRVAGQSYSQTIVPEAMQGQQRPVPRMADPGRVPGLIDRFRPRG